MRSDVTKCGKIWPDSVTRWFFSIYLCNIHLLVTVCHVTCRWFRHNQGYQKWNCLIRRLHFNKFFWLALSVMTFIIEARGLGLHFWVKIGEKMSLFGCRAELYRRSSFLSLLICIKPDPAVVKSSEAKTDLSLSFANLCSSAMMKGFPSFLPPCLGLMLWKKIIGMWPLTWKSCRSIPTKHNNKSMMVCAISAQLDVNPFNPNCKCPSMSLMSQALSLRLPFCFLVAEPRQEESVLQWSDKLKPKLLPAVMLISSDLRSNLFTPRQMRLLLLLLLLLAKLA